MPQSRTSKTGKLPNGNKVTVTTGVGRRGTYKTVTVRRPDGTVDSRSYRRGVASSSFLGGYDKTAPRWATNQTGRGSGNSARSGNAAKVIFGCIALLIYLFWPITIGAKTVAGKEHYSTVGIIVLAIWLPIAIGVPVLIAWAFKKSKRAASEVPAPQRREAARATALATAPSGPRAQAPLMQSPRSSATPPTTAPVVRGPGDPRWRWIQLAQQLPDSLRRFEAEYQEHQRGSTCPSGQPIADPDREWQRLIGEAQAISLAAAQLFQSATALFDTSKQVDEEYIAKFVDALVGKYAAMLQWSVRVRMTPTSPEWGKVFELLSRFLDEKIENVRRFSQWSIQFSKQALYGIPAAPLNLSTDITLKIGADIRAAAAQARAAEGVTQNDTRATATSKSESAPDKVKPSLPTNGVSVADELRKLADLRREGVLTSEEFDAQKAKLLQS